MGRLDLGRRLSQEKTIYNKIESIVGTPAADGFRDSVHKNFITRRDTLSEVLNGCAISGIREPLSAGIFSVYPNPASARLIIDVSRMKPGIKEICLYDAYGRMIFSVHCDEVKKEISLSALPNGIYFIRVQNGNESSVSKKIIKATSW